MADVFISYSRKDKDFVRRLDEALKSRKREAWVDWEGIRPTEEFMQAIYRAIEAADTFIFVLTPDSVASAVCGREVAHAVAHNKRLVPIVRYEMDAAKVPEALAKLNWIFCPDGDDFEKGIETLISALDTDLEWVHAHTRLLTRAIEWESKGKNNSFVLRGVDLRAAEQWLAQAGANKERQPTALQTEYILASRKAATRRQRVLLGGVTVALILTIALGILALIQRQLAVKREGEVRRTFSRSDFFRADELIAGQKRQEALAFLARAIRSDPSNHAAGRRILFLLIQHPWFALQTENSVSGTEFHPGGPVRTFRLGKAVAEKIKTLLIKESTQVDLDKSLQDVVFSPDRKKVAVFIENARGKIHVFDATSGEERFALESPAHVFPDEALEKSLRFSPDSSHLVAIGGYTSEYGSEGKVLIADADKGSAKEFILDHIVTDMAFSPDGKYLLVGYQLWRIDGDKLAKLVVLGPGSSGDLDSSLQFSADGRQIKAGVTLWRKVTRESILKIPGEDPADTIERNNQRHTDELRTDGLLAVSADGRLSVMKKGAAPLTIIDATSARRSVLGGSGAQARAEFSTDGDKLITTSKNGTGKVWRTESGEPIGEFRCTPGSSFDVVTAGRDCFFIVTSERGDSGRILDLTTLKPVGAPLQHARDIVSARFSPDGRRIVTASKDRTVRVWDSQSGKPLSDPIHLPEEYGNSAYFAPDGTFFVTHTGEMGNEQVQLWDAETGRALCEPIVEGGDQDKLPYASSYMSKGGDRLFVEFSEEGKQQVRYLSFGIPLTDGPVPAWLADLAEVIGGFRLTDENTLELLGADKRNDKLHRVATNASSGQGDQWSAVVRWLLDNREDAVVSPTSMLTVKQYVQKRVAEDTIASLQLAAEVRPDDPTIFRRLGEKHLAQARSKPNDSFAAWMAEASASRAVINVNRALALAPGDEGVQTLRAEVDGFLEARAVLTPTPSPTPSPVPSPTPPPTPQPTARPTPHPTARPTPQATIALNHPVRESFEQARQRLRDKWKAKKGALEQEKDYYEYQEDHSADDAVKDEWKRKKKAVEQTLDGLDDQEDADEDGLKHLYNRD
jgi:WD40 repeat protein